MTPAGDEDDRPSALGRRGPCQAWPVASSWALGGAPRHWCAARQGPHLAESFRRRRAAL